MCIVLYVANSRHCRLYKRCIMCTMLQHVKNMCM